MNMVVKGNADSLNARFKSLGIKREYSTDNVPGSRGGINVYATNGAGERIVIGEDYENSADAVADMNLDAFDAMASAAERWKKDAENPLPKRSVYETIIALTEVAVDGVEARKEDADGLDDIMHYEEGEYAVKRGQAIVAQYSDAYRGGDLPK